MNLKEKMKNKNGAMQEIDEFNLDGEAKSMYINTQLSTQIRLMRKKSGLTREQLAKQLNVSQYTISKWENLAHNFSISEICKISMALNIEDYLIELLTNIKGAK